ncbi:MAG: hypothetical protein FWE91_09125 [Defluviitaleaceae bacterium]|nr:hypothetical protein [Defluviitaleaceae bacterium]MCL2835786.1 hypothetical protein [Defluviitaleaceae bacterium]
MRQPKKPPTAKPTAWQTVLINLANLLKVKTIVTLAIVFSLCFKTLNGIAITNEFVMIATAVITYYFTKETDKTHKED